MKLGQLVGGNQPETNITPISNNLGESDWTQTSSLPTQVFKLYSTLTDVPYQRLVGAKSYELTDHLGNVRAVISDRKLLSTGSIWTATSSYMPDIISANDYYPFGMGMPGRTFSSPSYRYGFQGQEKDDEVKGSGNSLNYKYRMHDARLGRFFAVDPLAGKFSFMTPYQFAGNKPIWSREIEGLESQVDADGTITYKVQEGQGPTQIADDLKKDGYNISWESIVDNNPKYFEEIDGDKYDSTNPAYKKLNLNVGDQLTVGFDPAATSNPIQPIVKKQINSIPTKSRSKFVFKPQFTAKFSFGATIGIKERVFDGVIDAGSVNLVGLDDNEFYVLGHNLSNGGYSETDREINRVNEAHFFGIGDGEKNIYRGGLNGSLISTKKYTDYFVIRKATTIMYDKNIQVTNWSFNYEVGFGLILMPEGGINVIFNTDTIKQ